MTHSGRVVWSEDTILKTLKKNEKEELEKKSEHERPVWGILWHLTMTLQISITWTSPTVAAENAF